MKMGIKIRKNKKRSNKYTPPKLSYRRVLRNLSLALIVTLASILLITTFILFQKYTHSFATASSGINVNKEVDLKTRFNVLIGKLGNFSDPSSPFNELILMTVEESSKSLGFYRLPVDLEVKDLGGFGRNKISSLYGLANLTKNKDLGFILNQMQAVFAIPIDGFIFTDEKGYRLIVDKIGADFTLSYIKNGDFIFFIKNLFKLLDVIPHIKTNLDPLSLLNIIRSIAFSRFNNIEIYNLTGDSFLLSGVRIPTDRQIEEESKKIIVLNGTSIPLLASERSKLIGNIGGLILEVANAPDDQYVKSIIITNDNNSYTLRRLSKIFDISDIRSSISFSDDPKISPFLRADMIIIFGLDSLTKNQ